GGVARNVQAEAARLHDIESILGRGVVERMRTMTPEQRNEFIQQQLKYAQQQAASGEAAQGRRARLMQAFSNFNVNEQTFTSASAAGTAAPGIIARIRAAGIALPE